MDDRELKQEIRELLDARRPGSADERLMEMRELNEWIEASADNQQIVNRVEATDAMVCDALFDIESPVGLKEKLLANSRLNSRQDSRQVTDDLPTTATETVEEFESASSASFAELVEAAEAERTIEEFQQQVETAPADYPDSKSFFSLTRMIYVAALVAAIGATGYFSLLALGVFNHAEIRTVSKEQLGRDALDWDPFGDQWNAELANAPANYPMTNEVQTTAKRWRILPNPYDENCVVYDLSTTRSHIYLHVIRAKNVDFGLSTVFTARPIYPTSEFKVGAFKRGDLVYVLVVEGDQSQYEKVIKLPIGTA